MPILIEIGETGEISYNIEDFIKIYFPFIDSKNTKIRSSINALKKWNDNNKNWRNRETGEMVKSPFYWKLLKTHMEKVFS